MKKRGISALLVLVLALSLLPVTALAGTTFIHIDEERFPDENFRKYVEQFDVTGDEGVKDGYLGLNEREAVTKMEVQDRDIFSLKGVEYFPNLTYLNCNDNCIQELDLSQNPVLVELCCSYNPLFTLNISRNLALKELSCADCKLTQLDISHNTKLVKLACDRNSLTELDTSKNPALKELLCAMNKLTKLDISKNKQLDYLYAYQNKLTKLDISNNKKMYYLDVCKNSISTLDITNNPYLVRAYREGKDVSDSKKYHHYFYDGRERGEGDFFYALETDASTKLSCRVKPKILTHPKSVSVKVGKTVTFKVKAVGSGRTYQWYVMKKGTTKWAAMKGKTAASLKLTAKKSMNGFKYRCRVKNKWGYVRSKSARLTVK